MITMNGVEHDDITSIIVTDFWKSINNSLFNPFSVLLDFCSNHYRSYSVYCLDFEGA